MFGEVSGVNAKVREQYPEALFIHCYAHKLNLVLSQGVKRMNACKRFFSTPTGISAYFSRFTKRFAYLKEFVQTRIPGACDSRWNSNAPLVGSARAVYEDLQVFSRDIVEEPNGWDDTTVDAADGYLTKLNTEESTFLLEMFLLIFPHTETLLKKPFI